MGCIFFLILVSAEFNIYFSGASHNVKIKVNKLIIHVGCVVMLASESIDDRPAPALEQMCFNNDINCHDVGSLLFMHFPLHRSIYQSFQTEFRVILASSRTHGNYWSKKAILQPYSRQYLYGMADRVDRETGGFEAEFVLPLPEEYECPICQLAFRDPVQIEDCGHRFCQSCLQELKRRYI